MPERGDYVLNLSREMKTQFNNGFKDNLPTLEAVFYSRPTSSPTDQVGAIGGTVMFEELAEERGKYQELPIGEGYDKTFTQHTYFAGFSFDNDLWEDLSPFAKLHAAMQLGLAAGFSINYKLGAWLAGIPIGTSLGANDEAIGSISHNLKWGGTASNKTTAAYGETAFIALRKALAQTVDDRGNIQPWLPWALVFGSGLWGTVRKTHDSVLADAAHQINVAAGRMPVEVENPWGDDDDWTVLPEPYEGGPCMRLVRKAPDFYEGDDMRTREHYMNSRYRDDIGGVDYRGSFTSDVP